MVQNRGFNSLRLNADITLCNGGGAVLQKALDKGNVKAVGLINLSRVPLDKICGVLDCQPADLMEFVKDAE